MTPDDFGGEMDPHGADLRGNPIGGIMFSSNFSGSGFVQVIEWTNFMGGNAFCLKACDPAGANAANFCQHIYDRIGCAYNAPNNAQNGTFEACDSDNADFPGIFTSNGVVMTYTQPPESLGPITSIPFTARVAPSSNCQPFQSAQVFTGLPTLSTSSAAPTNTASGAGTRTNTGKPAQTGSTQGNTSNTGDASTIAASMIITVLGVAFSAVLLS